MCESKPHASSRISQSLIYRNIRKHHPPSNLCGSCKTWWKEKKGKTFGVGHGTSLCLISDFLHSFMKIGFSHQNSGEARYAIVWHLQNSERTDTSPLGSGAAGRYGESVESTFADETVLSTSVGIAEFSSGLTSKTTQGQSLNGQGPLFIFYVD